MKSIEKRIYRAAVRATAGDFFEDRKNEQKKKKSKLFLKKPRKMHKIEKANSESPFVLLFKLQTLCAIWHKVYLALGNTKKLEKNSKNFEKRY